MWLEDVPTGCDPIWSILFSGVKLDHYYYINAYHYHHDGLYVILCMKTNRAYKEEN
ncbi:hypothetical protein Bcell_3248 [Evansella cellulosilytica DSM 2522]|uniref:Uncharacterized protein n=1 Tax=Evansella cellulosilytica (strain ATCC 21833 / DSM 2522 / FERM P-1141 / JCM 9156 / N-4) TaxID=649639 RepID=E6U144_EVAC2|nr:hypothetical protein Bcell_3248 [Evansella cellulosilytica DSM 2522]